MGLDHSWQAFPRIFHRPHAYQHRADQKITHQRMDCMASIERAGAVARAVNERRESCEASPGRAGRRCLGL